LHCVKTICGGSCADRFFDIHLSQWLENDQRMIRCLFEGSIFGVNFLMSLHAVNDQPFFSDCDQTRKKFEAEISSSFDVELMGQAHWCLQARITQRANFDISFDQSGIPTRWDATSNASSGHSQGDSQSADAEARRVQQLFSDALILARTEEIR
jgi:hypothetical protein